MMLLTGESFGPKYQPKPNMSLLEVADWLGEKANIFLRLMREADFERGIHYNLTYQKIKRVRQAIIDEPEKYAHTYEGKRLVVFPIYPPKRLVESLLECSKLILLSATLYKSDISKLTDKPFGFLDLDSPIHKDRRRVIVDPAPIQFNYQTDPKLVAVWIRKILNKYPHRNTIIHVTYDWGRKLKPHLGKVLINTKDNKSDVLRKFKEKGGVWLAGGCAEGIDLKGESCTLNIIPILPRPNLGDPIVRKRRSLPGGQQAYDLTVLRKLQQQVGRSTRSEKDYSLIVVGDKETGRLIKKYSDKLSKTFLESIEER